jgi:hypothetical protein
MRLQLQKTVVLSNSFFISQPSSNSLSFMNVIADMQSDFFTMLLKSNECQYRPNDNYSPFLSPTLVNKEG